MTSSGSRSSAPDGGDDGAGGCIREDPLMTSSLGVPRAPVAAAAGMLASSAGSEGPEPEWSRGMDDVPGYRMSI